jgi:putative ABC transport system permease protein
MSLVKARMTLWRDFRHGVRVLSRAPGFTALTVIVLALGIGATTAIFSLFDAAIVRALPYHEADRLVMLWEAPPDSTHNRVAPLNYVDWSEQNHTFSTMAAIAGGGLTLTRPGALPERIAGQAVTTHFFDVFDVVPIAGRTFRAEDAEPEARAVVLSERLWRSHFAGDRTLVGRTIRFDGQPHTVIGIVPARFQILFPSDLWVVFKPQRTPEQRQMHYLQVVSRLRPGITIEQARADMAAIAQGIARISPATNKGWGVTVEPLRESLIGGDLKATAAVLIGIVGLVLLMACANVANLLLARGIGRTREIAVRAALGGTRCRLMQQLITESLLLASAGGAVGVALAGVLLRGAAVLIPPDMLPQGIELSLDLRVAIFAALLTIATGALFGLVPAWHAAQVPLVAAMSIGNRTSTERAGRMRVALATGEVAVAIVLLTGAGLLIRTLLSFDRVDPGNRERRVLTMVIVLPDSRYPTPEHMAAFYQEAERELEALPGVARVSFGGSLPFDGWDIGQSFTVVGDAAPDAAHLPAAHYQITGAGFFDTLGIPIVRGRAFGDGDTATSLPVCVVSEAFVRRYARGRDPLTLQVRVDGMSLQGPTPVTRQVVGVARQVLETPSDRGDSVQIYVPLTQNPWFWSTLSVRTMVPPATLQPAIAAAVARVDKDLALTQVRTIDEITAAATSQPRFRARLVTLFSVMALTVAAVGVAGLLAFSVRQRRRELGIRMALGARGADIVRLMLDDAVWVLSIGTVLGLVGAAALTRAMTTLLFGITPLDPITFVAAPAVLCATALAASAAPSWMAARTDPALALRQE